MSDFDDPLDDLLSDESFFEEKSKKFPEKSSKAVSDIFNLDPKIEPPDKVEKSLKSIENPIKIQEKPILETKKMEPFSKTFESRSRKNSIEKTDITDLLEPQDSNLKKSKSNLFDDILGISKTEDRVSNFDDILKKSAVKKDPPKKIIENVEKVEKTEKVEKMFGEPRRARRGSQNLDPLGLLDFPKSPEVKRKIENVEKNLEVKNTQSAVLDTEKTLFTVPRSPYEVADLVLQYITAKRCTMLYWSCICDLAEITTNTTLYIASLLRTVIFMLATAHGDLGPVHMRAILNILAVLVKEVQDLTKSSKSVSFLDSEFSTLKNRNRESPKKSQKVDQGLPDWLQENPAPILQESAKNLTESSKKDSEPELIPVSSAFDTMLKSQASDLEFQNSSFALNQQEAQLVYALQMKKYEQNLIELQKNQNAILSRQERQFNLLLEKQFEKQKNIEENMRLQQERINQHIQMLIAQPTSNFSNLKQDFENLNRKEEHLRDTFEENRNFYLEILSSLKQKHQEEISILEESYKKQIVFLENSLETTENRLKNEIENLTKFFNEKISELNIRNERLVLEYEEKIEKIQKANENTISELKKNYNDIISEIKNSYKNFFDDLNEKKKFSENSDKFIEISEKFSENSDMIKNNIEQINQLQNKISSEKNVLEDLKKGSLDAKDQEIKMMQESLEKQKIAIDNERAQLLALIKTLEIRLVEQTQASREERWSLQQAVATFSARSVAMDREIDYLKKNLEYEKEQLKVLKETQLAEHEKIMLQLTEEKLAVNAERTRLETSAKLAQNFDSSKNRMEIEMALQVAKEATNLTDFEREKFLKKQMEIANLKRILNDREKKLELRENEIENLTKIAEQKFRDGEKALVEAKLLESKCNEKMKDISKHSLILTNREKKLAEEKIFLSKERLEIKNLKENRCGLCRVDNGENFIEHDKVQDLELMRLKFELDDEIPTSIREME